MASVVNQGGQKVVGRSDSVEVPGEVQIDGFHRENLRVAATSCTALHTENRTQGGFTKCDGGLEAQTLQALSKGDRSGCFARTGWHTSSGYQNQTRTNLARRIEFHFSLVTTIGFKLGIFKARVMGELVDRDEFSCLGNFDIAKHANLL